MYGISDPLKRRFPFFHPKAPFSGSSGMVLCVSLCRPGEEVDRARGLALDKSLRSECVSVGVLSIKDGFTVWVGSSASSSDSLPAYPGTRRCSGSLHAARCESETGRGHGFV